ncbi:MAG TPA: right-handed parallel beta-helix repeat-containing protein [Thermoplasmata archaeon]|nr:right-handed parallel beta-helix repeat-containing protein [Thermoplasmata archaeon]
MPKLLGRTTTERRKNAAALVDEIPPSGRRRDEEARGALAREIAAGGTRRDALRWGAAVGGGVLAGVLASQLAGRVKGEPGDGIPGTTISNTDIDAKRIAGIRVASEFASAKHAGSAADPWPGAAIQAAVGDVPPTGGLVFIPAGTWSLPDPLRLGRSDLALVGTGSATRLVIPATNNFVANSSGMIEVSGAYSGLMIERLSLDGRNTDTCRGVLITGGSEVLVRDCTFLNWLGTLSQRGRGLTVVHNPATEAPPHKGVRVEACYFRDNQIGIVMHRTIYVIQDCYFESNLWDGIYIEGTGRGVIANNLVTFSPRTGIFLIFTDRETVLGNRIEDCGSGIQVYEARGMSMVGNHIERCSSAGIDIRTNSAHCVASGNVVGYCAGVPGIQLLSAALNCAITDNVCRGNEDGVAALGSSEHLIEGNVCMENTRAGVHVNNANHVRILANRAYAQPYGILADGSTDYLIVKDNDLRGNTTAAMSLVGANRIVGDNWEA